MVAKRPASYRDPKPRNPKLLEKTQNLAPGPQPQAPGKKLKKYQKYSKNWIGRGGKDLHPQEKIQHLVLTKDPWPLYYKTPPCVFYHKNIRSKAVFGP